MSISRAWLGRALVFLAGAVPLLWVILVRLVAPADGTAVFPSAPPWGPDGVVIQEVHADRSPLRPGDRVIAVNGTALETWAERPEYPGDHPVYRLVRDGTTIDVEVTLSRYPWTNAFGSHLPAMVFVGVQLAVAGFVILRRSRDPAARALFAAAVLQIAGGDAYPLSSQVVDVVTGRVWPTVVSDSANALFWGAMLHFAVVFPQRWPILARRPRLVAVIYIGPFLLYGVSALIRSAGATSLERLGLLAAVSPAAANVFPLLIVSALVVSYVKARDPLARQRMRWQLYTFGFGTAGYLGFGRLPEWLTGQPLIRYDLLVLFFLPCPIALGLAVLRYRLFDIQIILRRSLVHGLVFTGLLAGYLAVFQLLSLVFHPVPLPALAAVALTALPAGTYLRRIVSRRVFGARDDPYEVLRQLLDSTSSAQAVLDHVVETLSRTLRLAYTAIEVADGRAASHGTPTGTPVTIPLVHLGEHNGRLILDPGPLREPFGPSDERLLGGLARQVGVIAHNLLLAQRLQRSLERSISALEEERRRLRRDIHDGLGPTLASATMRLELARSLVGSDPATADVIFDSLVQTHHHALNDVRRLVDGLRPPVLDQLGLLPAVRERAARMSGHVVITVEADDNVEPLPAAVEVATYHIVSEALTNVVRHASATECTVKLCRGTGLYIEIRDNGKGLRPGYTAGVGLSSIRERCAELGGSADIQSGPGDGTVVAAQFPL